ncbi:N-acyl-D-amino-acid deacylase family protein [Luteimonas sp. RIT-PG2_3]
MSSRNPSRPQPFRLSLAVAVLLASCATASAAETPRRQFDILIRGGEIVDGTGAPRYRGDVGIDGDTIVAIGELSSTTARKVIDARGRIVSPGFVDMHAHVADDDSGLMGMLSEDPKRRAAQNYVAQGVTTTVGNPDGSQSMVLSEQRALLTRTGIGPNIALTNGHNGLRAMVMGRDQARPATAAEIARMRAILHEDLARHGSFGLSLGVEYFSGRYSTADEQLELARELPAYNGIFIPHVRSQGIAPMWYRPSVDGSTPPPTLDDSIDETLRVARETGATVVFTHMKAWGPGYRGHAQEIVDRLQAARDQGSRVFMDVYPYDSSGSDGDFVAIPPWAFGTAPRAQGEHVDGALVDYRQAVDATLKAADAKRRDDLSRDIRHTISLKGGVENIVVLAYPDPAYVGKRLSELMALRKLDDVALVLALQREGDASLPGGARMRSFSMDEEDIKTFYRQPWAATSTDGWVVLPEEAVGDKKYVNTNRRVFGSFPRRIAHYSQAQGVDTLEQAIRSMSGLPAQILSLADRGRIAVGMKADVTVLDLARLRDNTTYLEPSVYPDGIEHVIVNGTPVVDGGKRTLALPGKVLSPSASVVAP